MMVILWFGIMIMLSRQGNGDDHDDGDQGNQNHLNFYQHQS